MGWIRARGSPEEPFPGGRPLRPSARPPQSATKLRGDQPGACPHPAHPRVPGLGSHWCAHSSQAHPGAVRCQHCPRACEPCRCPARSRRQKRNAVRRHSHRRSTASPTRDRNRLHEMSAMLNMVLIAVCLFFSLKTFKPTEMNPQ